MIIPASSLKAAQNCNPPLDEAHSPFYYVTPYKERRQPGGSEQFGSVKAEETEAMKKTNAMRILEAAGIPYESVEYC